jgi:O-antigen ligase
LLAWADMLRMAPHFPLFGAGFNAFGTAYLPYQTLDKGDWWGEAHNEYLQLLLDTGLAGLLLLGALLRQIVPRLARAARSGPAGQLIVAALLGMALHNVVEFNWQIPANAATFAALLGGALRLAPAPVLTPPPSIPRIG